MSRTLLSVVWVRFPGIGAHPSASPSAVGEAREPRSIRRFAFQINALKWVIDSAARANPGEPARRRIFSIARLSFLAEADNADFGGTHGYRVAAHSERPLHGGRVDLRRRASVRAAAQDRAVGGRLSDGPADLPRLAVRRHRRRWRGRFDSSAGVCGSPQWARFGADLHRAVMRDRDADPFLVV